MSKLLTKSPLTQIEVGIKYEATWPEPISVGRALRTWLPGKSTHELIRNGVDLEIHQTSLEENTFGQTRILYIKD